MPGSASVTTYACFIASSGSSMPIISPTRPAHAPHAFTTCVVWTRRPSSVTTAVTRFAVPPPPAATSSVSIAPTRTPSATVAPRFRAALT